MLIFLIIIAFLIVLCSIASAVILFNIITLAIVGVPHLQTAKNDFSALYDFIGLSDQSVLYDLGCSGGDFLLYAGKRGLKRGVGIELAPLPYAAASLKLLLGRYKNIDVMWQDMFKADLTSATAVYLYLVPPLLPEVANKLSELRPKTVIVSRGAPLPGFAIVDKLVLNKKSGYAAFKHIK